MKNQSQSQFQKVLRSAGLKSTPPRLAVLAELSHGTHYASAQDIHKILDQKKDMDLVTVYRTLAAFEKAGIVKRVDLRKDAVAYELAGHHHHHIVCTSCGTVEDFELCDMDAIAKKVAKQATRFKTVSEHTLELFGVCTSCAR